MLDEFPCSQTVFGIPPSHHHCTFKNFKWEGRERLAGLIGKFCVDFFDQRAPHLILTGPTGIGKSHLSVAAYRHGVYRRGTQRCTWIDLAEFCAAVKQRISEPSCEDPFLKIQEARDLVVIDDLWGKELSAWEMTDVLFRVIQVAHLNRAAVVATTNHSKEVLLQRLAPHEFDRLFDGATVVAMQGTSWRTS